MRAPCIIEGCDSPRRGRGWCSKHWARWRKYGDPLIVKARGTWAPEKRPCSVDGCERLAHAHTYCTKHLARWQKHGDPLVIGERRGRPLKGNVPTYAAVHKRLTRTLGPAAQFECADCSGPAHEWSYSGGDPAELRAPATSTHPGCAYSLDPAHYSPRCRPCHRRRDDSLDRDRDAAGRWRAYAGDDRPAGVHIELTPLEAS